MLNKEEIQVGQIWKNKTYWIVLKIDKDAFKQETYHCLSLTSNIRFPWSEFFFKKRFVKIC
mgnify:CR=1 FL=1